jgi:hypothetical protein
MQDTWNVGTAQEFVTKPQQLAQSETIALARSVVLSRPNHRFYVALAEGRRIIGQKDLPKKRHIKVDKGLINLIN